MIVVLHAEYSKEEKANNYQKFLYADVISRNRFLIEYLLQYVRCST
jgi:hypothetical protein